MGTGAGQGQDEHVIFNRIDQNPIAFDVAIAKTFQVSGECMIPVLRRQLFATDKDLTTA